MKIKVIVAGFGKPELDLKRTILKKNVERLRTSVHDYDMDIYIYDDTFLIIDGIDVNYYYEKGYPGTYFYSYQNKELEGYDFVFLFMDDVELHFSVDDFFRDCLAQVSDTESTIFSPCLSSEIVRHDASLDHMFCKEGRDSPCKLVDQNLEYFCYFMDCPTFRRYVSYFTPSTKCMWGLDIVVPFRFNAYIMYNHTMTHYLQGGINGLDTMGEYNANLSSITLSDIRFLLTHTSEEWRNRLTILDRYLSEGMSVLDYQNETNLVLYTCCVRSCSEVYIMNNIRYFNRKDLNLVSRFVTLHFNQVKAGVDVGVIDVRYLNQRLDEFVRDIRQYIVLLYYTQKNNWTTLITDSYRIVYSSRKTDMMVIRCNRTPQGSIADPCP